MWLDYVWNTRLLTILLLIITRTSVAQDQRSLQMSVMAGWQFQCINHFSPPVVTTGVSNVLQCQIACLAESRCQAASFEQFTSSCQLFFNIQNQYGRLIAAVNTTTMIVIIGTRIPSVTTTSMSNGPSLWSFDNNTLDSLSGYDGVGTNYTIYQTPGINGYGAALSVNQLNGQYVTVPVYRNLTYRSFTIEMWFYAAAIPSTVSGLFGQYYNSFEDQALHCIIKNDMLSFNFFGDDLSGSTLIQNNTWYHVAFVFDYSAITQSIYLNGILDARRNSSSYQGLNGSIVIGKTEQILGSPHYFSGYIDEVSLVMQAKQSSEILDDATLLTWSSFDNGCYRDSSPLNLAVITSALTSINGRVNQAIFFNSSSSYYQVYGFVLLGVTGYSYSIALWTRPSWTNGSVLVHLSTQTDGNGWCVGLMGFSATGQIVVTGWGSTGYQVVGPVLSTNVWTHVVTTYSTTNGLRLYLNGTYVNSSIAFIYMASGGVDFLTLGNSLQGTPMSGGGVCNSQAIVSDPYYGAIDEFRVYSRELSSSDIITLANP